jgi:hypothetical protein
MLNAGQVNKFVAKFNLSGLKQIKGEWFAVDDGEIYHISEENYYGALNSGDLDS